jgi:S-adenosylmethionine decarboxylase
MCNSSCTEGGNAHIFDLYIMLPRRLNLWRPHTCMSVFHTKIVIEKRLATLMNTGILCLELIPLLAWGQGRASRNDSGQPGNEVDFMLHAMLDLYGCNPERLADPAFLRNVLEEYPDRIHMVKVGPAELRYITTSNVQDDGYSGFVIIATSHVSLHAWAPYRMINIDVFSCEDFSVDEVVTFACEAFQTRDVELHVAERATRSPRVPLRERPSERMTDVLTTF